MRKPTTCSTGCPCPSPTQAHTHHHPVQRSGGAPSWLAIPAMASRERATAALAYLTTGVVLNVVAQLVTDTHFADKSTHLVPWIK